MIKFYFHLSPNPLKIALYLEETGEPYELIAVDTRKGEQHADSLRLSTPTLRLQPWWTVMPMRDQQLNALRP